MLIIRQKLGTREGFSNYVNLISETLLIFCICAFKWAIILKIQRPHHHELMNLTERFFCVTCTAVLENRSIMCIIEACFVADMSPAMPSVILEGNKEARGKTSYGWRSLWCLHRGPCFVILFI